VDLCQNQFCAEGSLKAGSRQGSVLILVLWVLFFLTALTVAVGMHVSAAMSAAERLSSRTEQRCLAEAGAQMALVVALSQTNEWDGIAADAWNRGEDDFKDITVGGGFCSVAFLSSGSDGVTVTNIGIIGEDGRLNINTILDDDESKAALVALISSVGELSAGQAEPIVAAVADWIDENDEMLTGGAESGYYASQSPPYRCANGRMRNISELRMVKGVDRALYARLAPYVTVYGTGHVNMNCAPEPVIAALAQAHASHEIDVDVCESLAEKIGEFRRGGGAFRTDDDIRDAPEELGLTGDERGLFNDIPASGLDRMSTVFRGISFAVAGEGERPGIAVEFVFDKRSGTFVSWREFR
jgi:type II secretory pathway component PulK